MYYVTTDTYNFALFKLKLNMNFFERATIETTVWKPIYQLACVDRKN